MFALGRLGVNGGRPLPYAIAANSHFPERTVIALVGDGAMQMNNMAELITVANTGKQWANPRGLHRFEQPGT